MSTLSCLYRDCFVHIVAMLNAHHLCKLMWCGDVRLDRLTKSCPTKLEITLPTNVKSWIASAFFCSPNVTRIELISDDCSYTAAQISKLSPALASFAIRKRDVYYPAGNATDMTCVPPVMTINFAKAFPLLQSFTIGQPGKVFVPPNFVANWGAALVELNLSENILSLGNVQHLPKSLTALTCVLSSLDEDINIIDPQFPPNLLRATLTRRFTAYDHMTPAFLDAVVCHLPNSLLDFGFLVLSAHASRRFLYDLQLLHLTNLQSLFVRVYSMCGVELTLPLPIPPSATSVQYSLPQQVASDYPLESESRPNLVKLGVHGFKMDPAYVLHLPTNLQTLDWPYAKQNLAPELWHHLPRTLKNFQQFVVDGKLLLNKTLEELTSCMTIDLPQTLQEVFCKSATSDILAHLPPNLETLHITTTSIDGDVDHPTFGLVENSRLSKLASLIITTAAFDLTSLQNLLYARLEHLELHTRQVDILQFPFDAPCLRYLNNLNVAFCLPNECNAQVLPAVSALRESLQDLKIITFDNHTDGTPAWIFEYVPRSATFVLAHTIRWENELIAHLSKLPPRLLRLSISTIVHDNNNGCSINAGLVDASFLQYANTITLFNMCPQSIKASYQQVLDKLSQRRHLELSPTGTILTSWSPQFG